MAEDIAQRFTKAMLKPENIRNICTSAHIHHGKCISGNSRLILTDGRILSAKEIYEHCELQGNLFENKKNEHTIYDVSKLDFGVFSLNKETNKIEKKVVSLAWKLIGGTMIKLELRNGAVITTTPEHKYLIYRNSQIVDVEAENIILGDKVACFDSKQFKISKSNSMFIEKLFVENRLENGQIILQITEADPRLLFSEVFSITMSHEDVVYDFTVPDNHNFVAEGMFIHNTAMTDNLLAAAGLMSTKSAGNLEAGMATWQHADEQERLMTVDAANVSMIHDFAGQEFLINLIDTPGHVDFGGNVTRAMRAIDGTIVLVCASEGIMPQTETVLKQALRERVKPVLFLNKVDRLIKEMQYTPEQMQKRFTQIILEFNRLIEQIAEPEFREKWKVSIQDGSVAFGSARENWALSFSFMQKKGINFKDILKLYEMSEEDKKKWVWANAPLHEVILDMVIKHLPNPVEAQQYRIPKIWHGEKESEYGKDLINTNKNGKVAFCVTRITIDPKTGRELSAGRLFSGTVKSGMQVYLNNAKKYERVQQVYMYNGIRTQIMDYVVAGNVLALAGVKAEAGETITEQPEHPFEELKHIFEPVITKSIEPTKPQDLAKVVEVLKAAAKEDPSIKIHIDEQTGECLMSGMGELHLEIIENRIITEKGVQIKSSPPLVVYRETVTKKSIEVEGKSPNKHNKFYLTVEPLPDGIYKAIKNGDISEGRLKKKDDTIIKTLVNAGVEHKDALKFKTFYRGNALVDNTRGIVHIGEVMELILDGFDQVMDGGPLAREPCAKVLVTVTDCKLHEDSIHRGPAQVLPAVRDAIREAMVNAIAVIFEPMQILQIEAMMDHMGAISKLIANKRGQLLDMTQEGNYITVKAKLPVGEMFGLSSELRSATEGRGNFYVADQTYEKLPVELQQRLVQQIRQRKGLGANQ